MPDDETIILPEGMEGNTQAFFDVLKAVNESDDFDVNIDEEELRKKGEEGLKLLEADLQTRRENEKQELEKQEPEKQEAPKKENEDRPSGGRSIGLRQESSEDSFSYILKPIPEFGHYSVVKGLLDKNDLVKIETMIDSLNFSDGRVGHDNKGSLEKQTRKSSVGWIPQTDYTRWLYDKLAIAVRTQNDKRWGLDLYGCGEMIQYTRYSPGGKYNWHMDVGNSGRSVNRKVSLSVMISGKDECEGGEFEMHNTQKYDHIDLDKGDAVIFPSYMMHRVCPVKSGMRRSLVLWVSGPPFR